MTAQIREHLRLLSIFHYVVGGLGYLISLIPIIHLALGMFFLFAPEDIFDPRISPATPSAGEPDAAPAPVYSPNPNEIFPMRLFGVFFTVIPVLIILAGFTISTLIIEAGRRLARHRSHTFCLVVAGIECMIMPFGTVLGVFTILVLLKPETQKLFGLPVAGDAEVTEG